MALEGVKHEYVPDMRGDVMTWTVTFLQAYVGGPASVSAIAPDAASRTALAKLVGMARVEGGPVDELRLDVHLPPAPGTGGVPIVEFHNDRLDRYFLALGEAQAAAMDAAAATAGWARTGLLFKANSLERAPSPPFARPTVFAAPACAFHLLPAAPTDSWFYTVSAAECEQVKQQSGWRYEGTGFHAVPAGAGGRCPAGHLAVLRAYNNGAARGETNHRYTTSDSTLREMLRKGWADEGAVMCALP